MACGATAPWRETTAAGVRLAYDDRGEGRPLVCLHAIGHGARDFEAFAGALVPAHRVIALDWPGHGASGGDDVPPSAVRYAAVLEAFLERLALGPAVLVGNSIGGAAAIRLAAARPDLVAGLVLENPGGLDRLDALARRVIGLTAAFFAAGARGARWFPAAFAAYYRMILQRAPAAAQRGRIVAAGREIAPLLRDAWTSFGLPDADLRDLAPTLAPPVLFAWATRDQIVQLRRALPTIRRVPQARLERFPAGHAPHLETPDAFAAAVARFVATLTNDGRGRDTRRSSPEWSGTRA